MPWVRMLSAACLGLAWMAWAPGRFDPVGWAASIRWYNWPFEILFELFWWWYWTANALLLFFLVETVFMMVALSVVLLQGKMRGR